MSSTTTEVSAERLVTMELSRVFQLLLRIRSVAAPTVVTGGIALVVYGEVWRGLVCVGVALPVFLLAVWELRALRRRRLSPARIVAMLCTVLCVHFALAVVTGGITSPVLIFLPALAVFLAIGAGRPRLVYGVAALVVAAVWCLAAAALFAPSLEPALLARGPTPPALLLLVAYILTVAPFAAAIAGMRLRGALERAVTSAAESRSALVQSMRERNDELLALAGALAHELKNPLAAIRGLAALQARKLPEGTRQAEQMGVLLDEVARMGTILDEFLNFSRPTRGLLVEQVDPARIVDEVVRIHEPLAAERGVRLASDVSGAASMPCDPRKLKQVLVNLMQNAIDASPEGDEVTTRVALADGEHVLQVEDRGPGLADAVRGRLFTPGATTKTAGSGLGLTIARAIVEQHGGTLTLTEREGGGCVAEVRLPLEPDRDEGGPS